METTTTVLDARSQERPERILLVEDEARLRQVMELVLHQHGYAVTGAAHGPEALAVWQASEGGFDLLLTDICLPEGMNGLQLAEQLQQHRPDLKVLFTSGYSMPTIAGSCQRLVAGVNFLQKPYRAQDLAGTVRSCLGQADNEELPEPTCD